MQLRMISDIDDMEAACDLVAEARLPSPTIHRPVVDEPRPTQLFPVGIGKQLIEIRLDDLICLDVKFIPRHVVV